MRRSWQSLKKLELNETVSPRATDLLCSSYYIAIAVCFGLNTYLYVLQKQIALVIVILVILVILVTLVILVILEILVILVIMVILKLKEYVFSLPQTTMSKNG